MVALAANLTQLFRTYITAVHILHYHDVLDAYGHVSVRNPNNPSTFFLSRQIAPALVSSPDDIVEYRVSDGEPVQPDAPEGYLERYIHSEILKRYSGLNAVVHSHSPIMVSFSISRVPMKPAIHLAGYLGEEIPVFDISKYYNSTDIQDLLVRNVRLGAALASEFSSSPSSPDNSNATHQALPDHYVVLMQSHGFATGAPDLETAVFQAIYGQNDAAVQSDALQINAAYRSITGEHIPGPVYLTERQTRDSWETDRGTVDKPWGLWVREVKVSPLYINTLD